MPQYLVELAHTEADCDRALVTIKTYGLHILNYTWFGCMAGVHTGWATFEAENEPHARFALPPSMRAQARVVEVQKFTPEQIQQIQGSHKK